MSGTLMKVPIQLKRPLGSSGDRSLGEIINALVTGTEIEMDGLRGQRAKVGPGSIVTMQSGSQNDP